MNPLFRSFGMFLRQISRDSMLYAVCIAPVLSAFIFRFGVPYAEAMLCSWLGKPSVLAGYYLLIDLFLAVLTPFLFSFASSMVILAEYDENITGYLAVTPVGKKGYLVSRFAFPAAISFFASLVLVSLFALTDWTFLSLAAVCFLACVLSVAVSLLVVSLSRNRVEGMAVAKLSGIALLGLAVPFFLFSEFRYLFYPLPSFWIAKLSLSGNFLYLIPALLTSLLWILALYRRYERKLT